MTLLSERIDFSIRAVRRVTLIVSIPIMDVNAVAVLMQMQGHCFGAVVWRKRAKPHCLTENRGAHLNFLG
jgi:hypothetical protein